MFVYCCTLCIFRIYFGHSKNYCYFCFSEGQLLRPLVLVSYLNPAQPNSTHTTHLNASKHCTTFTSPTIFNQYQHNLTQPEPISTQLKSTQSKSNQPNITQLNPTQLNLPNPTQLNISKLKSTQPNSTQPIPIQPNPKMPIQPKANMC